MRTYIVSDHMIAEAFTLWESRFRDNPDSYYTLMQQRQDTPEEYGSKAALTLIGILKEDTSFVEVKHD